MKQFGVTSADHGAGKGVPSLRTIYDRPKKAWPKITTGTNERALLLSLFAQVETPFVSMSLPQQLRQVGDVRGDPRASSGAQLIKPRKNGHKFFAFTGSQVDFFQSLYHFGVFGTEFVDQRIGLFGERFHRLGIVLFLSRLHLIVEFS